MYTHSTYLAKFFALLPFYHERDRDNVVDDIHSINFCIDVDTDFVKLNLGPMPNGRRKTITLPSLPQL